jgi:hypothetical protein
MLLLLKILPKGLKLLWLGCFDELQIVVVLGHVPAIAAAAKPPISSCLLFHEPKQKCITEEFSQRKNLKEILIGVLFLNKLIFIELRF